MPTKTGSAKAQTSSQLKNQAVVPPKQRQVVTHQVSHDYVSRITLGVDEGLRQADRLIYPEGHECDDDCGCDQAARDLQQFRRTGIQIAE